jgi:hypothetical protein
MFGVFFFFAFTTDGGEPNWPVTAFASGLVLGILWMVDELRTADGWYRWLALGGLTAACLAGVLLTLFVHESRWFDSLLAPLSGPATAQQPYPLRRLDPTLRLRGWRTLATEVDRICNLLRTSNVDPVLAGTGWSTPGLLGFYCAGHPTVYSLGLAIGGRQSQYDLWRPNPLADADCFIGCTFVIVTAGPFDLGNAFERVETHTVTHKENGRPVAGWVVMVCHGYRGFGPQVNPAKIRRF